MLRSHGEAQEPTVAMDELRGGVDAGAEWGGDEMLDIDARADAGLVRR
jgi:hypothetical protein